MELDRAQQRVLADAVLKVVVCLGMMTSALCGENKRAKRWSMQDRSRERDRAVARAGLRSERSKRCATAQPPESCVVMYARLNGSHRFTTHPLARHRTEPNTSHTLSAAQRRVARTLYVSRVYSDRPHLSSQPRTPVPHTCRDFFGSSLRRYSAFRCPPLHHHSQCSRQTSRPCPHRQPHSLRQPAVAVVVARMRDAP